MNKQYVCIYIYIYIYIYVYIAIEQYKKHCYSGHNAQDNTGNITMWHCVSILNIKTHACAVERPSSRHELIRDWSLAAVQISDSCCDVSVTARWATRRPNQWQQYASKNRHNYNTETWRLTFSNCLDRRSEVVSKLYRIHRLRLQWLTIINCKCQIWQQSRML